MWLSRFRSEETHWTMKRAAKTNWPRKPMRTQKSQWRGSRLMALRFHFGFWILDFGLVIAIRVVSDNPKSKIQNPKTSQFLTNPIFQHPLSHPAHRKTIDESA